MPNMAEEFPEITKAVLKPVRQNVEISWQRKGKKRRIKVKKRLQSIKELTQLQKQRQAMAKEVVSFISFRHSWPPS
tara:strand:- start:1101 stop:1328 length:228 start_codon:yes stop_codon:yes gene_type:complete